MSEYPAPTAPIGEPVPPPYQAVPAPYQQTVVYETTSISQPLIPQIAWTEIPQRHRCQFCGHDVVTEVVYENGNLTWLVMGGLLIVGCWLGCCLIPLCVDSLKDPVHVCPHCHNVVGKKSRI